MKSPATDFAASKRFLGLKSSASILLDMSNTNTISIPSVMISSSVRPDWGLAKPITKSEIAKSRRANKIWRYFFLIENFSTFFTNPIFEYLKVPCLFLFFLRYQNIRIGKIINKNKNSGLANRNIF